MTFYRPKSKSASTTTAVTMEAWADDLRRAADGFEEAARLYRSGKARAGFGMSMGSAAMADMVVSQTRRKKL